MAAKNALLRVSRSLCTIPFAELVAQDMRKGMPINVWWDLSTFCVSPCTMVKDILKPQVRHRLNFHGHISIKVFANMDSLPSDIRSEFTSNSLIINNLSSELGIFLEMARAMMEWCDENPPPAAHFLLSGNLNLIPTLNEIKGRGYETLVGLPEDAPLASPPPYFIDQEELIR